MHAQQRPGTVPKLDDKQSNKNTTTIKKEQNKDVESILLQLVQSLFVSYVHSKYILKTEIVEKL